MFNLNAYLKEAEGAMQKAVEHVVRQLGTLHTGKASPQMLENVKVEAYGSEMRLKEIASITTPDARTLRVQPFDKTNLKAIEKAILLANLGIPAAIFGETVHCPLPDLSRERRQELAKTASQMTEAGKVGVRACRHDALKKGEDAKKEGHCTEDEEKQFEKAVQVLTDRYIQKLDALYKEKEGDLMSV